MEFNSPHLQSCFDTTKPILENIEDAKNAVSDDIKQLEAYLKSVSIPETIEHCVTNPHNLTNVDWGNGNNYMDSKSGIAFEEKLIWNHIQKRLFYVKYTYKCIDLDIPGSVEIVSDSRETIIEKPLIETSFEIRKYIYENNHLGYFLSSIANKFAIHTKPYFPEDDIPF